MDKILGWPQAVITSIFDWSRHVFSPLSLVRECLNHNLQNDTSTLVRTFWLFPIILTIVTDGAVLRFYGIEVKSEPIFTLLYLTFVNLKLFFEAFILYAVLRLMKVKVTQGLAFVCFSIVVMYNPLFSWVGIPQATKAYEVLMLLKAQHLGIADTFFYFWDHAKEINEKVTRPLSTIAPYLAIIGAGITLLSTTLVAECLSQLVKIERPKAYAATAIASALNLLPIILFNAFQLALVFAYLSEASVKSP